MEHGNQRYNFSEEDFRGERFKDFPHSLKGNNDLLSITASCNQRRLLILKPELISLKPIFSGTTNRNGRLPLRGSCLRAEF
jgi:hypothetical protein